MVTFPARKITDKRIYRNDGTSTVLFHDKNYSNKLMYQEIKDLNIRFNLYDLERKIFILKEIMSYYQNHPIKLINSLFFVNKKRRNNKY